MEIEVIEWKSCNVYVIKIIHVQNNYNTKQASLFLEAQGVCNGGRAGGKGVMKL